jgi:hypothetical protein
MIGGTIAHHNVATLRDIIVIRETRITLAPRIPFEPQTDRALPPAIADTTVLGRAVHHARHEGHR